MKYALKRFFVKKAFRLSMENLKRSLIYLFILINENAI